MKTVKSLGAKALSILIAVLMICSIIPMTAFADAFADERDVLGEKPDGAVVSVTDKDGYAVGAGDTFGEGEAAKAEPGYYKTLEAAVAACPKAANNTAAAEAGAVTIKMLSNVLIEKNNCMTIAKGQNIIIDLAGYDIAQECKTNAGSYVFYVSGILTIKDSTDEGADGIDCGTIYNYAGWDIDNDHPWGSSGYGFCNDLIRQYSGSTVTIESGELKNNGNYCPYCIDVHEGNTVTNIKGGWLHSPTSSSIRVIAYNSKNNNPQVLNISGGHLGSPTDVATLWLQTTNNTAKLYTTVNISGGLIQVRGNGSNYAISDDGGAEGMCYNISGGTVDCGEDGYAFYTNGADVNITGGTLGGLFAIKCTTEEENVKISGGTFKGKLSVFGQYAKKGFITGGNFVNQTNYDDAETLYVKANGSIWFKTRYFSEQDLTGKKYKCLQDYVDDGYVIHAKYGLNVKNKDDKDAGYSRLEQFEICTKDNKRTIDTVYIYETAEGWRTTPEERQRPFLKVWYEYEQQPGEYRFWDYWSYTRDAINEAIYYYGEGLTITQEDYDNTVFAEQYSYDFSYTNCKDLAILNDRMYRVKASWATSSSWLGTEQNPGPYAYKQIGGNLEAWETNGYILEKHGQENGYTQYYAYKSLGGSSLIAEGYVDKTNAENPNTYDVVPVEVNLGKAEIEEETIKVKGKEITVTYDKKAEPEAGTPTVVEAADAITETLNNTAVSGFLNTKIDDSTNTNDDAIKDRLKAEIADEDSEIKEALEAAIDEATINSETETKYDKRVDVDLKVADVVKTTTTDETTTLKVAVFDVQPNAKVTVKFTNTETGEVITERTYETPISNDEITDAISFRVPVNYKESAHAVRVWHKAKDAGLPVAGDESTYGESQGLKFVQTAANGDKFVELSSKTFSYWTYEIVDVEANAVAVIMDEEGNFRSFETLAAAIADWKSTDNEDDVSIILMQDIANIDFADAEIPLDLNGHFLNGTSTNAENVTISNSDSAAQETLAAEGTYKNNVSAFVADGFDVKTTTVEDDTVYSALKPGVYKVVVVTSADVDRDPETSDVDVYAGDHVYAEVRVYGARFVAADVTFTYDEDNFELWDSPMSLWEEENGGSFHFINAYNEASKYYVPDQVDENGNKYYVLGNFEFETKAIDEETLSGAPMLKVPFKVRAEATEGYRKTYVTGAWSEGWATEGANELDQDHLKNGYANIRLIDMAATVTPGANLLYQAQPQNLLTGFSAKDTTGHDITDAQISAFVIKKAEKEAIEEEFINKDLVMKYGGYDYAIYRTSTGQLNYSSSGIPAGGTAYHIDSIEDYLDIYPILAYWGFDNANCENIVSITGDVYTKYDGYDELYWEWGYTDGLPSTAATNAGDYVVYWKISSPGYVTATGTQEVSIGKQKVVLTWTPDNSSNPDNKFAVGPTDSMLDEGYTNDFTGFSVEYNKDLNTYATPKASFIFNGVTYECDVELTTFDGTAPELPVPLRQVGEYVFTASEDSGNFILCASANDTDPTKTFVVAGGKIKGYSLTNGSEGASCYYDGPDSQHVPAVLDIADDANPTSGVSITYYSMKAGDSAGWQASDTIPTFTTAGTYLVKAVATCDGYYDKELETVTFTIKNVDYKVESFDYVLGWDIVLVYTYEDVAGFTYNGYNMYNMDGLGYKFGSTKNADGTRGSEEFTHVFGYLVEGDADITTIIPSNIKATSVFLDGHEPKNRYDVNDSNTVETNDLTSVQGTYNVDTRFLADNMYIGLKADVSGDKMVDTLDINLIKVNSDNR